MTTKTYNAIKHEIEGFIGRFVTEDAEKSFLVRWVLDILAFFQPEREWLDTKVR